MNPVFFSLIFAAVAYGQGLMINTPANPVECQPTQITWSGGTPPYFLSILPGNQPSATALENIGELNVTSYTWPTDLPAGTSIGLDLKDSTGALAQSAAVTIQPGTSTSCIKGGGGSASGSSSSSAGTTPATTSATTPATTPATSAAATSKAATTTATTPASSSGSSGSSSTATGASGSSSTGAASANMANMGVAGVFGAAIMAILA